jgi:hypothetical protein
MEIEVDFVDLELWHAGNRMGESNIGGDLDPDSTNM